MSVSDRNPAAREYMEKVAIRPALWPLTERGLRQARILTHPMHTGGVLGTIGAVRGAMRGAPYGIGWGIGEALGTGGAYMGLGAGLSALGRKIDMRALVDRLARGGKALTAEEKRIIARIAQGDKANIRRLAAVSGVAGVGVGAGAMAGKEKVAGISAPISRFLTTPAGVFTRMGLPLTAVGAAMGGMAGGPVGASIGTAAGMGLGGLMGALQRSHRQMAAAGSAGRILLEGGRKMTKDDYRLLKLIRGIEGKRTAKAALIAGGAGAGAGYLGGKAISKKD
jgi:hypothetical protein